MDTKIDLLEERYDTLKEDIKEIKKRINNINDKLEQTIINQKVMTEGLIRVTDSVSEMMKYLKEYGSLQTNIDTLVKQVNDLDRQIMRIDDQGTRHCPVNSRKLEDLENRLAKIENRWWTVTGVLIMQLLQIIYILAKLKIF